MGTIGILEVQGSGLNNQNDARALLSDLSATPRVTGSSSTVNFVENGGAGNFGGDSPILLGNGRDNFAAIYQGTIRVPQTGVYTFGITSDDGFTLAFDNGTSPFSSPFGDGTTLDTYNGTANGALTFFAGRGNANSLGQITLTAGDHPFVLTWHDGCCGAAIEFYSAAGEQTSFNGNFNLVGAPASTTGRKLPQTSTWQVAQFTGVSSLAASITAYETTLDADTTNDPAGLIRVSTQTINFSDPQAGGSGSHGADAVAFPGDTAADDDNFGVGARLTLTVGAGDVGLYSFLVFADDGSRIRLLDSTNNPVALFGNSGGSAIDTNNDTINDAVTTNDGCCFDYVAKWELLQGTYTLEGIMNERGGGAGFFIYGAQGDRNSFGPEFQLVGAGINDVVNRPAGLQLVPEPTSALLFAVGGLALIRRRHRSVA
jgi:hypothetical protein